MTDPVDAAAAYQKGREKWWPMVKEANIKPGCAHAVAIDSKARSKASARCFLMRDDLQRTPARVLRAASPSRPARSRAALARMPRPTANNARCEDRSGVAGPYTVLW